MAVRWKKIPANHVVQNRLYFLLEGPECYKDTQMKTYNITKLIAVAKLKSNHERQRNKMYYFVACFRQLT